MILLSYLIIQKSDVEEFCKKLNLQYVAGAKKPLTIGFKKALQKLNRKPEEAIILGWSSSDRCSWC